MIDQYSGPIIDIVLISFLILFNYVYIKRKFDLVWLFVNIHLSSLIFFLSFQSTLLNPMEYDFFILVLIYTIGFIIGYILHYYTTKYNQTDNKLSKINYKRLYRLNVLGFFIFCLAFTYELSQSSWVMPIFAANKLLAYYIFPTNFVHYLVVAGIPISGVFAYIAEHYKYKRKIIYFFIFIISVLFLVQLARAILMAQIFTVLFIYFKENNVRLTWTKIFLFILFLLALIVLLGTIRTSDEMGMLLKIGGMKDWPLWSLPFAWVYLYFTTPLENIRDVVSWYSDDFKYGVLSFLSPLANLLQMKENEFFIANIGERSAGGFNTFGYYMDAYVDFGYLGYLYTMFIGYISRYLIVSNNVALYLFSSFWVYAIFTSSVNMYFNQFFTLVYLVYYLLIIKVANLRIRII